MDERAFKDSAYAHFAAVTKGLSSPRRLELLDVLAQRPRSVDDLSHQVGLTVANTSQHLQVLRRATLVESERQGTSIIYRLAPGVPRVLVALRELAEERSRPLAKTRDEFFGERQAGRALGRGDVLRRVRRGRAVLIDLRPPEEYLAGHLPGARSVPLDQLPDRLDELPRELEVITTGRGPFSGECAQALAVLRQAGYHATRHDGGPAEWIAAGGHLVTGAVP